MFLLYLGTALTQRSFDPNMKICPRFGSAKTSDGIHMARPLGPGLHDRSINRLAVTWHQNLEAGIFQHPLKKEHSVTIQAFYVSLKEPSDLQVLGRSG